MRNLPALLLLPLLLVACSGNSGNNDHDACDAGATSGGPRIPYTGNCQRTPLGR